MKHALALTIGHNSSAVYIVNGTVVCGYEEERFTQKKSESQFPYNAIEEILLHHAIPADVKIYVSHWLLDGVLVENKYFDPNFLIHKFPDCTIDSHILGKFTHHDGHAEAAMAFAGHFKDMYHMYVMDGFGTAGECISVYQVRFGERTLLFRAYGFEKSVGMFYQYATAFCGMEMFNHEYKMLAYETRITNLPVDLDAIDEYIHEFSKGVMKGILTSSLSNKLDPMITLDALVNTREFVDKTLSDYLNQFGFTEADTLTKRILVSYFAQSYAENIVMGLNSHIAPKNLVVAGGVFYNVKINCLLAEDISGTFCVYPLAGDQGAGLGVYQYYNQDLEWPENLLWGTRSLEYDALDDVTSILVLEEDQAWKAIAEELEDVGFVNVVRGAMEFGPRALCNTTTLAMPTPAIAELINKMNNRTNEMPFALVCTREQAEYMFEGIGKVHKSLEYMIITRRFRTKRQALEVEGGAHYYPLTDDYTCRPQITDDPQMVKLLERFGPLINTSWNYHGVPIVFNTEQVLYTHTQECLALPDVDFATVVIRE